MIDENGRDLSLTGFALQAIRSALEWGQEAWTARRGVRATSGVGAARDDIPGWAKRLAAELVEEYGGLDVAEFGRAVARYIAHHPDLPDYHALMRAAADLYRGAGPNRMHAG